MQVTVIIALVIPDNLTCDLCLHYFKVGSNYICNLALSFEIRGQDDYPFGLLDRVCHHEIIQAHLIKPCTAFIGSCYLHRSFMRIKSLFLSEGYLFDVALGVHKVVTAPFYKLKSYISVCHRLLKLFSILRLGSGDLH